MAKAEPALAPCHKLWIYRNGRLFVLSDIFGTGRRTGRGGRRGDDLRYNLSIAFEEAAFGLETKIQLPRHQHCETCHGSGAKPGTSPVSCPSCSGTGQVRFQQGFFSLTRPCPDCQGEGKKVVDPCSNCHGTGLVRSKKNLSLKIPAGIETGNRLKLTGEGEPGSQGGLPGDLYVVISVKDHPIIPTSATYGEFGYFVEGRPRKNEIVATRRAVQMGGGVHFFAETLIPTR